MIDRLVTWIIARAMRTPYFHLPGYMNRYWLVPFADAEGKDGCYVAHWRRNPFVWLCQRLGVALRVHEILRGDTGDFYHDHPASFISLILRKGYLERRPVFNHGMYSHDVTQWFGPGRVLYRRFSDWHRIEFIGPEPVYTLVLWFPWRQKWGYLTQPRFKQYYRDVHRAASQRLPEIR